MNFTPGTHTRAYRALPTSSPSKSYSPVSYSSLDLRPGKTSTVEPVTVTVIDTPRLPGKVERSVVEILLTGLLCGIGAIGFFSYTVQFAVDTVSEQRIQQQ